MKKNSLSEVPPKYRDWRYHKKSVLVGKDFFVFRLSYHKTNPIYILLKIDIDIDLAKLQDYLGQNDWLLSKNEKIRAVEIPGEGNMNVVLRVLTDQRSIIIKQSRPYVQKYREIAAPLERIAVEHRFYKAIRNKNLKAHFPKILGFDKQNNILLLEDLGHCNDMTGLYQKREIEPSELEKLVFILGLIHQSAVPHDFPGNMDMRLLNHQHIFVLPFMEDNGFSLDDIQPGLQELSLPYKSDSALKAIIDEIGNRYLSKGDTLLHGDYYPGSWMTESNQLFIIDPEFGFVGFAEFDLGIMAAHLIMATGKDSYLSEICDRYEGSVNKKLMSQIAGIEIMRRLIGLAQLPLRRTIEEKKSLLKKAKKLIII